MGQKLLKNVFCLYPRTTSCILHKLTLRLKSSCSSLRLKSSWRLKSSSAASRATSIEATKDREWRIFLFWTQNASQEDHGAFLKNSSRRWLMQNDFHQRETHDCNSFFTQKSFWKFSKTRFVKIDALNMELLQLWRNKQQSHVSFQSQEVFPLSWLRIFLKKTKQKHHIVT